LFQIHGHELDGGTPTHTANWTAGYAKGTTVITLSNTTGLAVGSILILDQLKDGSDTGNFYVRNTISSCSDEGGSTGGRTNRPQEQWTRVTAINTGTGQVTISPGLYAPNWRSGQTPQAVWGNDTIQNSGIEDLSMNHGSSDAQTGSTWFNYYQVWYKSVRDINSDRNTFGSIRERERKSGIPTSSAPRTLRLRVYGVETVMTSDNLIENNIFQHIVAPIMLDGASSGSVYGYNFAINDFYDTSPGQMMGEIWVHDAGVDNVLFEGNVGPGMFSDIITGRTTWIQPSETTS